MFVSFLILHVSVLGTVFAGTRNCASYYRPPYYIGEHRVPTTCNLEQLDCPSSWKSGIPQGSETSIPIIYQKFLNCHESFTLCGYVPIDPKSGEVLEENGVTIGAGVDLGSKSWVSFTSLPSVLVDKLDPYFGLKRNLAACTAIERPLRLTLGEANTLTDAVKNDVVNTVSKRYDRDKDENALAFTSVPRGIRTAIVSVWYQFGSDTAHSIFWSFVKKNDWNNAIHELRNFYTNPNEQARKDLKRRNDEADIIEATLLECDRAVDVVFLIDDSSSVSLANFQESLDFVKNMIKAFPDQKLTGKYSTRFGLSTFNNIYRSQFYLSSYTKQSSYLYAIGRVSYTGGSSTNLAFALVQVLTDQFTEKRAKNIRDENIVIYAIGIDNYNLRQLQDIASSDSHVYTLSTFSELDIFISTITSSTCYEPRPAQLDEAIITSVVKNSYKYFSYKVSKTSNLEINVIDLTGSTLVYVSRTNPHPYQYDYDISFDFSQQKNKLIVVSARTPVPNTKVKRSAKDEHTQQIYVSVTSHTNLASFIIKGDECNPLKCTEGTNEMPIYTTQPTTRTTPTDHGSIVIPANIMVASFGMLTMLFQIYWV
ncbi:pesticin domain [Paramuricea clavata]|uniref:Pesticin domain n=1 Tax=Paramuricea clavata TaxID=317549 RepID=A0A7D9K2K6_PARCT|nr:pesticin domain [Paramuricea clavata]